MPSSFVGWPATPWRSSSLNFAQIWQASQPFASGKHEPRNFWRVESALQDRLILIACTLAVLALVGIAVVLYLYLFDYATFEAEFRAFLGSSDWYLPRKARRRALSDPEPKSSYMDILSDPRPFFGPRPRAMNPQSACMLVQKLPVEVRLLVYERLLLARGARRLRLTDQKSPKLYVQEAHKRSRLKGSLFRPSWRPRAMQYMSLLISCRFMYVRWYMLILHASC